MMFLQQKKSRVLIASGAAVLLAFVFTACDTPVSGDGAVSAGDPRRPGGALLLSAGDGPADQAASKKIKVKFQVLNGGMGLWWTQGIVSTEDDNFLVYDSGIYACDFYITLDAPAGDKYLNIRWRAYDTSARVYYLKAKMKVAGAGNYTITLDYNHSIFSSSWSIVTKNLYDVTAHEWEDEGGDREGDYDYFSAMERAVRNGG